MEDGTTAVMQPGKLFMRSGIRHLLRPRPPEKEKRYQRLLALRTSNPELFQLEVARMKERHGCRGKSKEKPPVVYDVAEIILQRRASCLQRNGPVPLGFAPLFLTDLREATCATKAEAEEYRRLVNVDPANSVLRVYDRKTGLVDEEFTARMIERYREDPGESGITAVAASVTGFEDNMYKKLINTSVLEIVNRRTDEVREGISVLKLEHDKLGESSGSVVTTSGNEDKMLCDCA